MQCKAKDAEQILSRAIPRNGGLTNSPTQLLNCPFHIGRQVFMLKRLFYLSQGIGLSSFSVASQADHIRKDRIIGWYH